MVDLNVFLAGANKNRIKFIFLGNTHVATSNVRHLESRKIEKKSTAKYTFSVLAPEKCTVTANWINRQAPDYFIITSSICNSTFFPLLLLTLKHVRCCVPASRDCLHHTTDCMRAYRTTRYSLPACKPFKKEKCMGFWSVHSVGAASNGSWRERMLFIICGYSFVTQPLTRTHHTYATL